MKNVEYQNRMELFAIVNRRERERNWKENSSALVASELKRAYQMIVISNAIDSRCVFFLADISFENESNQFFNENSYQSVLIYLSRRTKKQVLFFFTTQHIAESTDKVIFFFNLINSIRVCQTLFLFYIWLNHENGNRDSARILMIDEWRTDRLCAFFSLLLLLGF